MSRNRRLEGLRFFDVPVTMKRKLFTCREWVMVSLPEHLQEFANGWVTPQEDHRV